MSNTYKTDYNDEIQVALKKLGIDRLGCAKMLSHIIHMGISKVNPHPPYEIPTKRIFD